MDNEVQHTLTLTNRESLTVTAVSDVDAFNEEIISAVCDFGELTIKGELLHVEELSLESGILTVSGKINSLEYTQRLSSTSVLKKLFGG